MVSFIKGQNVDVRAVDANGEAVYIKRTYDIKSGNTISEDAMTPEGEFISSWSKDSSTGETSVSIPTNEEVRSGDMLLPEQANVTVGKNGKLKYSKYYGESNNPESDFNQALYESKLKALNPDFAKQIDELQLASNHNYSAQSNDQNVSIITDGKNVVIKTETYAQDYSVKSQVWKFHNDEPVKDKVVIAVGDNFANNIGNLSDSDKFPSLQAIPKEILGKIKQDFAGATYKIEHCSEITANNCVANPKKDVDEKHLNR
jgi:hypothetical protein